MPRRLQALLCALVGLLIVGAGRSEAACFRYPTVAEEFAEAEFVYVAFVQAATVVGEDPDDWFDAVQYTVTPLNVFKGDPPPELVLWSENSTGRFPMRPTGTYLLFVPPEHPVGWEGELRGRSIDNCGNSFEMAGLSLAIAPPVSEGTLEAALLHHPGLNGLADRSQDCLLLRRAVLDPQDAGHGEQLLRTLRCDALPGDAEWLTRRFEGYSTALQAVAAITLE